jgi:hypothetical protein
MKHGVLLMSILAAMSLSASRAQSPAPIVVQAAGTATAQKPSAPATNQSPVAQDFASLQAALKSLQEIKAANAETLKRQEAAIQQLDELQKAADQMKIFSKRG